MCVPARTSIMTGKTVFGHGMYVNGRSSTVMGREGTLPTLLHDLGYQTAAIGKMHFSPERTRHGFDEMLIPTDYYRWLERSGQPWQPMRHGVGQNELYPTQATVPESLTLTNWIAQQCLEYILERRDPSVPFFLWCSLSKPHPPLDPPEPYYSMYRDCDIPEPVFGDWCSGERCPAPVARYREQLSTDLIPPNVIRAARAAYYGLITQCDYSMGRVFSALQDKRLFDDALILYTSDHGEYLGDHKQGGKFFFHEPSAHVPFVLRLPQSWDNRGHGSESNQLVTHADVLPTLVTAAGGTPPEDVEGLDLLSVVRGERAPRPYLEASADWNFFALTDGRWKYIYYPEGAVEQLFDLETDPQELTNLAGNPRCAEKQAALRDELIRRHESRGSEWVADGRLVEKPLRGDSAADRRNQSWMGYHTEHFREDIRH